MRIAMVSEHASPLAALGGVDAGGQNVHVAALSLHLARLGHEVHVYTRRDDEALPEVVALAPSVAVHHVDAGPPAPLSKDELLPYMPELGRRLLAAWSETPPEVVHAHFWMSGIAARDACEALRVVADARVVPGNEQQLARAAPARHQQDFFPGAPAAGEQGAQEGEAPGPQGRAVGQDGHGLAARAAREFRGQATLLACGADPVLDAGVLTVPQLQAGDLTGHDTGWCVGDERGDPHPVGVGEPQRIRPQLGVASMRLEASELQLRLCSGDEDKSTSGRRISEDLVPQASDLSDRRHELPVINDECAWFE